MGKRLAVTSPMDTAGLRWQPETWPMAKAMVRTVSPKAKATPTYPMPRWTPAARTALPQPPKTSQKVPKNSAIARFVRFIVSPLFPKDLSVRQKTLDGPSDRSSDLARLRREGFGVAES